MTTTISDLPRDLVEEILTRVPLESMKAVRLTCKTWNALSKSPSFTTMNIGREEEAARERGESRMIVLKDCNLLLVSIVVSENRSTKLLGKLTCINDSERIKIFQVFNCEGLLLCTLEGDHSKVVVWNPYLGHIRWIQTNKSCPNRLVEISFAYSYMFTYALGYERKKKKNKSWRSHKILRFIVKKFVRYEIYDFDSDLWTTRDVWPDWRIPNQHSGVSLKGNTYWCAAPRNSYGVIDHIICFDFTSKRFGPLLPMPFQAVAYRRDDNITLFCVREEKLAVLYNPRYSSKTEVRITTKVEATKVLWSKFFTFYMPDYLSGKRFLFDEEKKIGIFFENCWEKWLKITSVTGGDVYLREMDLGKPTLWEFVCSYVPSLVQIKKPE